MASILSDLLGSQSSAPSGAYLGSLTAGQLASLKAGQSFTQDGWQYSYGQNPFSVQSANTDGSTAVENNGPMGFWAQNLNAPNLGVGDTYGVGYDTNTGKLATNFDTQSTSVGSLAKETVSDLGTIAAMAAAMYAAGTGLAGLTGASAAAGGSGAAASGEAMSGMDLAADGAASGGNALSGFASGGSEAMSGMDLAADGSASGGNELSGFASDATGDAVQGNSVNALDRATGAPYGSDAAFDWKGALSTIKQGLSLGSGISSILGGASSGAGGGAASYSGGGIAGTTQASSPGGAQAMGGAAGSLEGVASTLLTARDTFGYGKTMLA